MANPADDRRGAGLVADLGGTHIRIGIVRPGAPMQVERFGWDETPDPAALLVAMSRRAGAGVTASVTGAVIALAGPVTGGTGRMTNRDCLLTETALSEALAAPVRLINDMTALGWSLDVAGGDAPVILAARPGAGPDNDQALVVNAGTGFNICPVRLTPGATPAAFASEAGHAPLPHTVARALHEAVPDPARFSTIEQLFAGPGLAALHGAMGGQGHDFAAAARAGDPQALATLDLAAGLFGLLCADLALRHWPGAGIWLAGSAALAMGGRHAALSRGWDAGIAAGGPVAAALSGVTLRAIADDLAPLRGAARMLVTITQGAWRNPPD